MLQLGQDASLQGWLVIVSSLTVGALIYQTLSVFWRPRRKKPYYNFRYTNVVSPFTPATGSGIGDAANQLRHVMAASFHKKPVMNKSEYKIFKIVEEEVSGRKRGHRVFSQTALGEVISSDNKSAFASINSKRVDILVVQPNGEPFAVFEYQGHGHYQDMAAARDAVKKEALRKAGVHYIEIRHDHEQDEIRQMVRRIM
ncbi:MAG: DUF2726 domain-containing protein [Rhizobiaceae bacterium]|nr:DUF2726 domain-containing protein [Rhizobiaceae bacterium]